MADKTREEIARTLAAGRATGRGRVWLGAGLVAAVALGGWLALGPGSGAGGVSYTTEAATRGDLTVTVTATGTVQPTTEVEVSSELSGTLATVEVDYNDAVEVGQVLARLDDTKFKAQVANAEAALASARAQLAQAEATETETRAIYDAQKALADRGVVKHTDFVTYQANYLRAQASVEAAQAALTLAQANLALEQDDLDKSVIRSPIKGVVLDRAYSAGQIVAASLNAPTLFTLAEDLREMEVQVDIDEADIGVVKVGDSARFTVDAYSGRAFPAVIKQVRYAPEETDDVVTYKAVLTVDNADLVLRPGMTATATITVAEAQDVLMVPNAALRYAPPQAETATGGGAGGLVGLVMPRPPGQSGQATKTSDKTIWVLRAGVPTEIAVTPGASDGKRTIVTAEGLAAGDLVITDQREAAQ